MSNLKVILHPAAMFQISDHSTRSRYDTNTYPYRVGILLGTTDGLSVEVHSSLPGSATLSDGVVTIDHECLSRLLLQHVAIYKTEVIVGWYSCLPLKPTDFRLLTDAFQRELRENDEILVSAEFLHDRDPQLAVYLSKGDTQVPVDYSYESELAERIAIMQLQSEGNAESQVQFTADAYRSLENHLKLIEDYLNDVANGKKPFDPVLVKKAADIAQWWNHSASNQTENRELEEANLALLVGLMAERLVDFEGHARAVRT
jgi:hypothetical protein